MAVVKKPAMFINSQLLTVLSVFQAGTLPRMVHAFLRARSGYFLL